MAADAALNVVRQIQAIADGPPTQEMRDCLGQVFSSLQFFLDHPDSRVRLNASRTLLKLARGYNEDVARLDLSKARAALSRCREADPSAGVEASTEELRKILEEMFSIGALRGDGEVDGDANDVATPAISHTATDSASRPAVAAHDDRGEVVLQVGDSADRQAKAAILDKIVGLPGVVSVTFEGAFVIVNTRTTSVASDESFRRDLLATVRAEGVEGASLVDGRGGATGAGDPASEAADVGAFEDEEAEPAYLDDDDDEPEGGGANGFAGGPGGAPGFARPGGGAFTGDPSVPQWSFFSQTNWMTGRRLQEFEDDPTIAARLAKAKQREEVRRNEDKSRLGRLGAWLTG